MRKSLVAVMVALALTATACTGGGGGSKPKKADAQKTGQALTEQAFDQQQKAVPYPVADLKDSLERRNLRERLKRTNDPNKIGYVYLMNFGKIVGYYAIKGKVSNTDSQMTTSVIVKQHDCGANCGYSDVIPAPGDDGSYGFNESGNFFFTTEGVFVETDLQYLYADQPLPIDVPRLNAKGAAK